MVNRYRLPKKVGPSPAESEPGVRNMASRVQSSRTMNSEVEGDRAASTAGAEAAMDGALDRQAEGGEVGLPPRSSPAAGALAKAAERPIKVTILFRLPLAEMDRLRDMPAVQELGTDYVLRALTKGARAEIRALQPEGGLEGLSEAAARVFTAAPRDLTVGETMTVYLSRGVLGAMHAALGDPWQIEPKAGVVNAYMAALVSRAIAARTV